MAASSKYFLLILLLLFRREFASEPGDDFSDLNKAKMNHFKRDVLIGIMCILMLATFILVSCFCFLHWRLERARLNKEKVAMKSVFPLLSIQTYQAPIRRWFAHWFELQNTSDTAVVHQIDSEPVTTLSPPSLSSLMPTSGTQHSILMVHPSTLQPEETVHNYRYHLNNTPDDHVQQRPCYTLDLENNLQCPGCFAELVNHIRYVTQAVEAGEEIRLTDYDLFFSKQ